MLARWRTKCAQRRCKTEAAQSCDVDFEPFPRNIFARYHKYDPYHGCNGFEHDINKPRRESDRFN
jgi:hypothetical protein